ncbi:MAG: WhiB family transcriptional regulator [Acidimicrobiia bacterium]|nr:WhiB family transcriptional regulator [Acidimicrobiia bacterium]
MIILEPTETDTEAWRADARCRDGAASLVALFFSDDRDDIGRAKAFCRACPVRRPCLESALEREEPCGVWGGELVADGRVQLEIPRRGRPPKVRRPDPYFDHWSEGLSA